MGWASLLLNKYVATVAFVAFLACAVWYAGDRHGHKAQTATDNTAITAAVNRATKAESANATQAATIQSLKTANQHYADIASLAQAQEQRAESDLRQQVQDSAKSLADAQKAVKHVYDTNPDAALWSRTAVPEPVSRLLH